MGRKHIDVTVESPATAEAIYALLVDGASWPEWSGFDSFELEQPGEDGPASVGAVRVFRIGRLTSRERIVELVPGRRYSYRYLSGLPIKDYRADVDLDPSPSGTTIHWRSSFRPKLVGTGWAFQLMLRRFIRDTARRVSAHAAGGARQ